MSNRTTKDNLVYRWLSWVPLIVLIALFTIATLNWSRKENLFQSQLARFSAGEVSTRDQAIQVASDPDRQELTERWLEMLDALDALDWTYGRFGNIHQASDEQQVLFFPSSEPNNDFPVADLVHQYALDAQPIIEAIKQLVDDEEFAVQEIWLPTTHAGPQTVLPRTQQNRELASLLSAVFVDAFYRGDTDRALFVLRAFECFFGEPLESPYMVVEMVRQSCIKQQLELIAQSMQHDVWSPEELQTIESLLVGSSSSYKAWSNGRKSEMKMMLDVMSKDAAPSYVSSVERELLTRHISPSAKLSLLRRATWNVDDKTAQDRESDWREFGRQGNVLWNADWSTDSWINYPMISDDWKLQALMPARRNSGESVALTKITESRARLATAIRRYRKQFSKWPDAASDLQKVGLSRDDWSDPFGTAMQITRTADDGIRVSHLDGDSKWATWDMHQRENVYRLIRSFDPLVFDAE